MPKFRKKPIVIEAEQFDGSKIPLLCAMDYGVQFHDCSPEADSFLSVDTLEGTMYANVGDYIIRGVNRELYPCKPDIFEKTYDRVEGDS